MSALENHIAALRSNPLFDGTDFKLASYDLPPGAGITRECGFTSLSIRIVKELVTFRSHPLLEFPAIMNAGKHLSASEFHSVLRNAGEGVVGSDLESVSMRDEEVVLFDARNLYETRIGKFRMPGVVTVDPEIWQYSELPAWIDEHAERLRNKCVLMKWDEEYGLGDTEPTVLAFLLLRLQGYHVSADVLKRLKDGKGTFSCFTVETPSAILGMLNLYKCSQFSFPSELDIMEEARDFAISQLNIALSGNEPFLKTNNLRSEIKFAFDYPRRYLLPRLESRSIIRQLWCSNGRKMKYLEVARRDMEILQKQYKQEMFKIERWWEENTVEELPFNRGHILKSFFLVSATMFEPQFSAYRVAFTKSATLAVLLDDLFDYPASDNDGLSRFTESIQRWDPSPLNNYPEHKAVFVAIQSSMLEIATKSSKAQGRDLLPYFKTLWQDLVSWYYKETDWKYFPTLEEYVENGKCSIAAITCYCSSMFLLGDAITDDVMQHVGRDSRLLLFVGLIARLSNDIVTYQREVMSGETVSSVSCYMRDNPGCTEEEAITSLRQRVESTWNEFQLELFSCHSVVPESCRQAMLSLLRMYAFSYKNIDAYTESSDTQFEDHYNDYLYGSLP